MADPTADQAKDDIVERFLALSPAIRGCAVVGPGGAVAASGECAPWLDAAQALFRAADLAAGAPASHAHVATEDGEAYAVRAGGLEMVAVTDRFTLASLVLADMRAALRAASSAPVAAEVAT